MTTYFYTLVTRTQMITSQTTIASYFSNACVQLEHQFKARGIPASKVDLDNGDRAYRVADNWTYRLTLDLQGGMFLSNISGKFYFTETDPTLGKAVKDDIWIPLGP